MKPEVLKAIDEIKDAFGDDNVEVIPDSEGGAIVKVLSIELGDEFTPDTIWCGFHINYMYPESTIYPHFVNLDLKRNGEKLPGPYQNREWQKIQCIQVSRKSKRWNPSRDTALVKLYQVINFIQNS